MWADALFAIDRDWWNTYITDINKNFLGDRFVANPSQDDWDVTSISNLTCYGNSGIGSISLAIVGGASKIILLGYDCKITNGLKHWHGNHPRHLTNAVRLDTWKDKFDEFSKTVNIPIINCSRETALTCFKQQPLEKALYG